MKKSKRIAATALAGALALGVGTGLVWAQDEETALGTEDAVLRADASFGDLSGVSGNDEVSEKVSRVASAIRHFGADQYAGLSVDDANSSIDLHWKGELSAELEKVIAEARELGVTVNVDSAAKFSRTTLFPAMDKLMADKWVQKLGIAFGELNPDGSGITVYVLGAAPSDQMLQELADEVGLPAGAITFVENSEPVVAQSG